MTTPAPPPQRVPPGAAPPPPPAAGGGSWLTNRSMGNIPNWAWILIIAGGATAIILFLRSRSASKQAAQAQPAAAPVTGTTQGACYDQAGNVVPCTQADYAAQIAALQAEIDNLQGAPSVPPAGTGTIPTSPQTVPAPQPAAPAAVVTQPATQPQGSPPPAATLLRTTTGAPAGTGQPA